MSFLNACENGDLEMVKILVEKGADIRVYGDYSVRLASENGHLETVKFLVEKGANIRANNDYAVRWASQCGRLEVVKFLVEKGAPELEVSDRCKKYIAFCKKMEEKTRVRAQKKIYFWWIPICYSLEHPSGRCIRMREKNLEAFRVMLE